MDGGMREHRGSVWSSVDSWSLFGPAGEHNDVCVFHVAHRRTEDEREFGNDQRTRLPLEKFETSLICDQPSPRTKQCVSGGWKGAGCVESLSFLYC